MIIGLLGFSSSSGVKLMICIFSENSQFQMVFNLHVVEHSILKEFFLFSLYHWLLLHFNVLFYVFGSFLPQLTLDYLDLKKS